MTHQRNFSLLLTIFFWMLLAHLPESFAQQEPRIQLNRVSSSFQVFAEAYVFVDKNGNTEREDDEVSWVFESDFRENWNAADPLSSGDIEPFEDYQNFSKSVPLQTATLDEYTNSASATATHDIELKFSETGAFLGVKGTMAAMVEDTDGYVETNGSGGLGTGRGWFRAEFIVHESVPVSFTGTIRASGPNNVREAVSASIHLVSSSPVNYLQKFTNFNPGDEVISFNEEFQELPPSAYVVTVEAIVSQVHRAEDNGLSDARVEFDLSLDPPPPPPPDPEEIQWNNPQGGNFDTAANWDPEEVPGIGDAAVFGLAENYTVKAAVDNGPHTVDRLFIGGDPAADVKFTDTALTVQGGSPEHPSVVIDNGIFAIYGGTLTSNHAVIGTEAATKVYIWDITGESAWENPGRLTIGGGGEATLEVSFGGNLTSGESIIGDSPDGIAFGDVYVRSGSEWNAGNLAVGKQSHGSLSIEEGGKVSAKFIHLAEGNSLGTIAVSGASPSTGEASHLSASDDLYLANSEESLATLVVEAGGVATIDGVVHLGNTGVGQLTVSGVHSGSELPSVFQAKAGMFLGFVSDGFAVIEQKASLLSGISVIGQYGEMNVQDAGSSWILDDSLYMETGEGGKGILEISDGGRVSAPDMSLAGTLTLSGQSEGQASTLSSSGILSLAFQENDAVIVQIEAGAVAEATHWELAEGVNSTVDVQIVGAGTDGSPSTLRKTGPDTIIEVADRGTVSMKVLEGGLADFAGSVILGGQEGQANWEVRGIHADTGNRSTVVVEDKLDIAWSQGQLDILEGGKVSCRSVTLFPNGSVKVLGASHSDPSHWEIEKELEILETTMTLDSEGAVTIGEATPMPGRVRIGTGGTLSGVGTIVANVDNDGGVDAFEGSVISVGTSPGTLTIEGNLTAEPGATLLVEVAGTEQGVQYDCLQVTGNVDFRGTVILKFLDAFAPSIGQEFTFIDGQGAMNVEIAEVIVVNLEPGFEYSLTTQEGRTSFSPQSNGVYITPPEVVFSSGLTESGHFFIDATGSTLGDQFTIERSTNLSDWIQVDRYRHLNDDPVQLLRHFPSNASSVFYRVTRD